MSALKLVNRSAAPRAAAKPVGVRLPGKAVSRRAVKPMAFKDGKDSDDVTAQLAETVGPVVKDLQDKWEATEEKPAVIAISIAAFLAIWTANGVITAVDKIPVISDLLELEGILVTGWFVYRYLLNSTDRAELVSNLKGFYAKMGGKL